jgi:hypothetical protein
VSTPHQARLINQALSAPRMATYERAVVAEADYLPVAALELYDWNAQVSGAFMAPLHICEVVMRNAVSDALTSVYGALWPWSPVFEASLPAPPFGYNPRRDLQRNRAAHPTTGKVIPELKFVFWQKMFTSRHDGRVWSPHLMQVLPNLDRTKTVAQLRGEIYHDLEHVRLLRNRIAHHEPIFKRPLRDDLYKVTDLVRFRCATTATWMMDAQWVTQHLS